MYVSVPPALVRAIGPNPPDLPRDWSERNGRPSRPASAAVANNHQSDARAEAVLRALGREAVIVRTLSLTRSSLR